MNISFDLVGTYYEHKEFFDNLATSMQKQGHRVGIISGERESQRQRFLRELGFTPDFMYLWPDEEFIVNGSRWKVEKIQEENVTVHFDDDAKEIKKFTDRWIIKTLNPAEQEKF